MRKFFLSAAALALVASPAFAGEFNKVVSPGDPSPAIANIPAVHGAKDATINLGDVKEDVVVVVFLANHCPVVTAYEDRIIEFAKAYKDKGVKVVGLCVNDNETDKLPAIKTRVQEKGYNYVYGYDASQQVGRAFGATNTPQFFVLDKDRKIQYMGALDDNRNEEKVEKQFVRDAVDSILSGKPVEVAETQPVGCGIRYNKK